MVSLGGVWCYPCAVLWLRCIRDPVCDEGTGQYVKIGRLENVREASSSVTGWVGRSRVFLAQVKNEMERVTWPTRKEVYATTLVVILTSVLFGLYLWGIDLVLNRFAGFLFAMFGAR